MERSQWYIGAPNGVVVCVDNLEEYRVSGRFYHKYAGAQTAFVNMEQLLWRMEQLFDRLNFPCATTTERSFYKVKPAIARIQERTTVMSDEELLKKHGDLGTFVVRVQHRQNNSWQGRLTWMEENRTICFRSIWELIKLIESAVNISAGPEEQEEPSWFEVEQSDLPALKQG